MAVVKSEPSLSPLLSSALDCRVSCWRAALFSLGGDGVSGPLEQKAVDTQLGGNVVALAGYDLYLDGLRNWAGCWIRGRVCRSCRYFLATSSNRKEATLPSTAVMGEFLSRPDFGERWPSRLVATAADRLSKGK